MGWVPRKGDGEAAGARRGTQGGAEAGARLKGEEACGQEAETKGGQEGQKRRGGGDSCHVVGSWWIRVCESVQVAVSSISVQVDLAVPNHMSDDYHSIMSFYSNS